MRVSVCVWGSMHVCVSKQKQHAAKSTLKIVCPFNCWGAVVTVCVCWYVCVSVWLSADSLDCYFVYFYGNYSNFSKIEQLFKALPSLSSFSSSLILLSVHTAYPVKFKLKLTLCAFTSNLELPFLLCAFLSPLPIDHVSLISRSLVGVFHLAILLLWVPIETLART